MKLRKPYYITACALLVGGMVLTGISVAAGSWNTDKYAKAMNLKDRYFEVTESFASIDCQTDIMDIVVQPAKGDICTISATNMPDDRIYVTVKDAHSALIRSRRKRTGVEPFPTRHCSADIRGNYLSTGSRFMKM